MKNLNALIRDRWMALLILVALPFAAVAQTNYPCPAVFSNSTTGGNNSYTFSPTTGSSIRLIRSGTWNVPAGLTIDGVTYDNSNIPDTIVGRLDVILNGSVPIATNPTFSFNIDCVTESHYNSSGTTNFTVPLGVTCLQVEAWGGGGCSGNNTSGRARGGGGGGAYSKAILTVVPASLVAVTVGAGGIYDNASTATDDGGASSAGPVIANGGLRGVIGNNVPVNGGAGGAASADPGGVIAFASNPGGQGGNGYVAGDNGGGGGGGESASPAGPGNDGSDGTAGGVGGAGGTGIDKGGDGGRGADNDGTPNSGDGTTPGGGGGGRGDDNGNNTNGADGKVIITWGPSVTCATCFDPTDGGIIGSDSAHCGTFNPDNIVSIAPASGYSGTGTLEYKWQRSLDSASSWTDIPVSDSSEYNPALSGLTVWYQRLARYCGGSWTATSNIVKMTVLTLDPGLIGSDQTICAGDTVALLTSVQDANLSPVRYDWFSSSDSLLFYQIVGEDSAFYNPGVLYNKTHFLRTATASLSCTYQWSNVITINVNPNPSVLISGDDQICPGESSLLTANPSGGAPGYSFLWSDGGNTSNDTTVAPALTTTYVVTVTDGEGCTATDDFEVAVYDAPVVDITGDDEICIGDSTLLTASVSGGTPDYSYLWSPGGNTSNDTTVKPATSTSYYVTVTDDNGCTATDDVFITVHPLPVVTFSPFSPDSICNDVPGIPLTGGSPAGGTYSGPGVVHPNFYPIFVSTGSHVITYTYTDVNGCTNSATRAIKVLPLPVVTHPDMPVCADKLSLILAGGSPAGGTYSGAHVTGNIFNVASAGVGAHTVNYSYTNPINGCSKLVQFTVTVHALPVVTLQPMPGVCADAPAFELTNGTPAGGTYSGPGVSAGWFNPSAAGAGTWQIKYKYTNGNGCSDSAFTGITVLPLPVPNLGADKVICLNECVVLSASGGGSYLWSTGSTTPSITVCPTDTTVFSVTVTGANGCTDSEDIVVNVKPLPAAAVNSPTICPGQNAVLTASGGATYAWSTGASTSSVPVAPATTTTYTVTVTGSNGCSAAVDATVTVLPAPPANAGQDVAICKYTCTTLDASGGVGYLWSNSANTDTTTVCPTTTTTYTVTVTGSNGCTATDQVVVTVLSLPTPYAGPDVFICKGLSTTLTASGGVSYAWSTGASTSSTPVSPATTTTYTVTVTGANGCTASAAVVVNVLAVPLVNAGNDTTIALGDTLQVNASVSGGAPGYTLLWTPSAYLSSPALEDPKAFPPLTTTYVLKATDQNGCSGTDNIVVAVSWRLNAAHGKLYYENRFSTPLKGARVIATTAAKSLPDTAITDGFGHYIIDSLPNGSYRFTGFAEGLLPIGSINATDALLVLKHAVLIDTLSGLPLIAGDANGDQSVNATDAFLIGQYFASQISVFPAGRWVFEKWDTSLSGNVLVAHDIAGLGIGDVNASFIPAFSKTSTALKLETKEALSYATNREINIPVSVSREITAGAASIVMTLPANLFVNSISFTSGYSLLNYSFNDGILRIAWASSNAVEISKDEILFTIHALATGPLDNNFILGEESEIADADAREILDLKLYIPMLQADGDLKLLTYPNPASDLVNIDLVLPFDAGVNLEIYNYQGEKVMEVFSGNLAAGQHNLKWNTGSVAPGVYFCRVNGTGGGNQISQVVRIVIIP